MSFLTFFQSLSWQIDRVHDEGKREMSERLSQGELYRGIPEESDYNHRIFRREHRRRRHADGKV